MPRPLLETRIALRDKNHDLGLAAAVNRQRVEWPFGTLTSSARMASRIEVARLRQLEKVGGFRGGQLAMEVEVRWGCGPHVPFTSKRC